jgi:hypothetical protein
MRTRSDAWKSRLTDSYGNDGVSHAKSADHMNRYDRNLQIIYIAIVLSALIYGIVAWVTTRAIVPGRILTDELHDPVTIAMYSAAAGMFLAAVIVRSRKALIVRWVMLDAACVFGVVAAMTQGDWRLYVAPGALALFGFIALYPRVRMATR